jgi:hypothetical protein
MQTVQGPRTEKNSYDQLSENRRNSDAREQGCENLSRRKQDGNQQCELKAGRHYY